jgi:hypothetical protein
MDGNTKSCEELNKHIQGNKNFTKASMFMEAFLLKRKTFKQCRTHMILIILNLITLIFK